MTRARVVRLRSGRYSIQRKDWTTLWLGWWTTPIKWESEDSCRRYCDELNSWGHSVEHPNDPVEVVCPERKPL